MIAINNKNSNDFECTRSVAKNMQVIKKVPIRITHIFIAFDE